MEKFSTQTENRLVSSELLYIFTIINYGILCVGFSLCGIVTNSINVIVFLRLGFKETINISLFGMAISDLILEIMTLWVSMCLNPWLEGADASAAEAISYAGAWVQVITTRVTGWITAFVTFERCLCVAMPLKVKDIISPARTTAVIASIFVATIVCMVPVYFTFKVGKVYEPKFNRSVISLIYPEGREALQRAMFYVNNVVSPLGSFIAVVICTVILSISITRSARWRKEVSSSALKGDNNSSSSSNVREWKVIKLVTSIAGIYIVCYTPTITIFVLMVEKPEYYSFSGTYRNLFLLLTSFAFLFESMNSTLNVFIYYMMSSRYRDTFRLIFCKTNN